MRKCHTGGRGSRARGIVQLAIAAAMFTAANDAPAQVSGTWTNLGVTPDFSDPYNWSSFPNIPGGGGEVIFDGPYRSQLNIALSQNVELSRIANVGSLGMRISGGTGSITVVGTAEVYSAIGPVGSPNQFRYTDIISRTIQGSAGLTKVGPGAIAILGQNSYTGGVRVQEGWLVVANSSLGDASNTLTLDGGGILTGSDLSARQIQIDSAGGRVHIGSSGTFGSISGQGNLLFSADAISSFGTVSFAGTANHIGTTSLLVPRTRLIPSSDGAMHGRLSASTRIDASGIFEIGNGIIAPPSDCINDAATLALRGAFATFNPTGAAAEMIDAMRLDSGRSVTNGTFAAGRLERATGATWRLDGASQPAFTASPTLVGNGDAGTPTVGVLSYASHRATGLAPVTVDAGRVRPLVASEQYTLAQLPSPNSPDANLNAGASSISSPISVRSLQCALLQNSAATITINGGGIYVEGVGSISNAIDFGSSEGFVHTRTSGSTGATFQAPISGTAGLTTSGYVVLAAANTYTGPTHANGTLEIRSSVIAGMPSPLGMDSSPLGIHGDSATPGVLKLIAPAFQPLRIEKPIRFTSDSTRPAAIRASQIASSSIIFAGNIEVNGLLNIGDNSDTVPIIVSGNVTGPGTLRVVNGGTTTLSGDNSHMGGTELIRPIRIGSDTAFGSGPIWAETASNSSIVIEAMGGPRSIANALFLSIGSTANTHRFTGTQPLTFTSMANAYGTATIDLLATAPLTFAGGFINHPVITTGTGTLQLAWYRGRGIDSQGGRINFLAGDNDTSSRAESLNIAPTAIVDLNDHTMVIDRGGGTITGGETGVRAMLAGGRLISSVAAANPGTAIGYARAGDVLGIGPGDAPAAFAGQLVREDDLLVRYTLAGDADLNLIVDIDDFSRLATNFNLPDSTWAKGDFNYDAIADIGDFAVLAANFNQTLPLNRSAVPEPAAVALVVPLLMRRVNNRKN